MGSAVVGRGRQKQAAGSGILDAGFPWPLNHTRDTPNDAPDDDALGDEATGCFVTTFRLLLAA
jgi:hypothetical protein